MPLHQTSSPLRRTTRPVAEAMRSPGSPSANEIPFDYVSTFDLTGIRGTRIQDVINISVEGAFVAVAIGYSFIPAPLISLPEIEVSVVNGGSQRVSIASIFANKLAAEIAKDNTYSPNLNSLESGLSSILQPFLDPRLLTQCLLTKICGINFKYSIVDSGSGRELQNQPIHNIAGLGESNGDRPFRPFAKPMMFLPRSTIRIEIEEISEGPLYAGAELYIVLHGYKMLGYGTALS